MGSVDDTPPATSATTTTSEAMCPQNYPICRTDGDCVISNCASGGSCTWRKARGADVDPAGVYNYVDGIGDGNGNDGAYDDFSYCKVDYKASPGPAPTPTHSVDDTPPATTSTTSEALCPQNYPICGKDGDCVISKCASGGPRGSGGGCRWSKAGGADVDPAGGYNYVDGIGDGNGNDGAYDDFTYCTGDFKAPPSPAPTPEPPTPEPTAEADC